MTYKSNNIFAIFKLVIELFYNVKVGVSVKITISIVRNKLKCTYNT